MQTTLRALIGYTSRVMRDLRCHLKGIPAGLLREEIRDALLLTGRQLTQKPKDKHKIFSLHEPKVECIFKGKARVWYEFGIKVLVAATKVEAFIVGSRSMPRDPYDTHKLADALY